MIKKNNLGLVSIIMPAFNAEKTISQSISSVLNQSYENFELIIIDDSSTDKTLDIARGNDDKRIKIISNTINSGVAKSRNIGIATANGQYIAFLDSDDLWYKDKLEKQIHAMKSYKVACSHGQYDLIDENGHHLDKKIIAKSIVNIIDMRKYNHIGNLTGLYDCWEIGKIYQDNIGHEDYRMWCEVLKRTKSIGINDTIASYRIRKGSVSSNKIRCISWHYNALRTSHNINILQRTYYMTHYLINGIKKLYI